MSKAFYITGIALTIIFAVVIAYYGEEVSDARYDDIFSSYSSYSGSSSYYGSYSSPYSTADSSSSITEEAGLVSLLFFLFFVAISIIGLLKVKTTTNKILSIIGLSLTGIMLLWDFGMIADSGALSFDEVGIGFLFFDIIFLAFMIVGLVQCFVYEKKSKA